VKRLVGVVLAMLMWEVMYYVVVSPHTMLDELVIYGVGVSAREMLRWAGITATFNNRDFCCGEGCLWIGDNCSSLELMGIYLIVVMFMPMVWYFRLAFAIVGLLVIFAMNILRIAFLGYALVNMPYVLEFYHNVIFNIIVFCGIALMWYMAFRAGKPAAADTK